ncbi:hypothetical protein CTA1_3124 [Colletotrichum tanaceti]|uniref:Secreted protein n=1 Tax=Colletotrichum tanaceti TaxID=1306861 RepID=A0A4V6DIE4_9PEZI|nr:hypothetical protein CTA1_3124 [Colletotrichum tanaceti]
MRSVMRPLLIFALWATFLQELITCHDFVGYSLEEEYQHGISVDIWNIYYRDFMGGHTPVVRAELRWYRRTLVVLNEAEESHREENGDDAQVLDDILAYLWQEKGTQRRPQKLYYKKVRRPDIIQAVTQARRYRNKDPDSVGFLPSFEILPKHTEAWQVMMESRYGEVAHDFAKHFAKVVTKITFKSRWPNEFEGITFHFKWLCTSCGSLHT